VGQVLPLSVRHVFAKAGPPASAAVASNAQIKTDLMRAAFHPEGNEQAKPTFPSCAGYRPVSNAA